MATELAWLRVAVRDLMAIHFLPAVRNGVPCFRNPHELGPPLSRRPIDSVSSKEHTQGSDGMLNEYHVPVEWGHDGLGWYGNNWGMTCLVQ
jgi:hypothetical protein